MAKKTKQRNSSAKKISNRRARFDYDLDNGLVVGIALSGAETKALRLGHGHIRGAYVTIKGNELWLINATISGDNAAKISDEHQTRSRKLLAKRKEIDALIAEKQQGKTIVPLEILTGGRYIKIRISTGTGRKRYDKRQIIKKREETRSIARQYR